MKKTFFCSVIISIFLLTGCNMDVKPFVDEKDTYSADLAVNANEYSFIIGKEITTICNQIISQQSNMTNAGDGTNNTRLIRACENSISTINECRYVIQTTRPAIGYENDREGILDSIDAVIGILQDYLSSLESNGTDFSLYIKRLNTEYSILTSYQSVYYN